jgi:hypothetical protein
MPSNEEKTLDENQDSSIITELDDSMNTQRLVALIEESKKENSPKLKQKLLMKSRKSIEKAHKTLANKIRRTSTKDTPVARTPNSSCRISSRLATLKKTKLSKKDSAPLPIETLEEVEEEEGINMSDQGEMMTNAQEQEEEEAIESTTDNETPEIKEKKAGDGNEESAWEIGKTAEETIPCTESVKRTSGTNIHTCSHCPEGMNTLHNDENGTPYMAQPYSKTWYNSKLEFLRHVLQKHPECQTAIPANSEKMWLDVEGKTWWSRDEQEEMKTAQKRRNKTRQTVHYTKAKEVQERAVCHFELTKTGRLKLNEFKCSCGEAMRTKGQTEANWLMKEHVKNKHFRDGAEHYILIPRNAENEDSKLAQEQEGEKEIWKWENYRWCHATLTPESRGSIVEEKGKAPLAIIRKGKNDKQECVLCGRTWTMDKKHHWRKTLNSRVVSTNQRAQARKHISACHTEPMIMGIAGGHELIYQKKNKHKLAQESTPLGTDMLEIMDEISGVKVTKMDTENIPDRSDKTDSSAGSEEEEYTANVHPEGEEAKGATEDACDALLLPASEAATDAPPPGGRPQTTKNTGELPPEEVKGSTTQDPNQSPPETSTDS